MATDHHEELSYLRFQDKKLGVCLKLREGYGTEKR
jgi:hypothetical protein